MFGEIVLPVNHHGAADLDKQTFLWSSDADHRLDVAGYKEELR